MRWLFFVGGPLAGSSWFLTSNVGEVAVPASAPVGKYAPRPGTSDDAACEWYWHPSELVGS